MEIEEGGKSSGRSTLLNISPYFEQELAEILNTTVKQGFEDIIWGNNFAEISDQPPYRFGFFIITSLRLICVYFESDMNNGKPVRPFLNLGTEVRSQSLGASLDWLMVGPVHAAALRSLQGQKIIVNYPTTTLTAKEKASRVVKTFDNSKLAVKDLMSGWYGEIHLKSVVAKFQPDDQVALTFIDTEAAQRAYESIKSH